MSKVRLRHLAQINPPAPAFDRLGTDDELTFLPMESVWPGAWRGLSRSRTKAEVATGFTRFQNGDVLVPKITPTFEAGRAVLVDGLRNGVGAGTTELHVLRAGRDLDNRFLLYVANTHWFLKMGEAEMYGVAGQQRVPDSFLRNLEVTLLPLEEQRRIADFLDAETSRIDRLVQSRTAQTRLLSDRWQSGLAECMEELMSSYGSVRLRHLMRGIEQGWSPQCDDRQVEQGEWGVVKAGCVNGGVFDPSQHKALPQGIEPRTEYMLEVGDLLMSRASGSPDLIGSVGVVRSVPYRLLLCDKVYRIRLDHRRVESNYVAIALRSHRVREHIRNGISGAEGMANNLPTPVVKDCVVPDAPVNVQRRVINTLAARQDGTQRVIERIKESITLLSERRQALITAAVTGQFDVSTASGRNTTQGV